MMRRKAQQPSTKLVVMLVCVAFLLFVNINLFNNRDSVLTLTHFPVLPRADEPLMVTATVKNHGESAKEYALEFFLDGVRGTEARIVVDAQSAKRLAYIVDSPNLVNGEYVVASAKLRDSERTYESYVQIPPAPPEIWSSFVAFSLSSFSTVTYMATQSYYQANFLGQTVGFNLGLFVSLFLIGLLLFLELSHPVYGRLGSKLRELRVRYGWAAVSLVVIFLAIVVSKVLAVLGVGG